jgi:hypothetical protein
MLRIYSNSTTTLWGEVPINLRTSIPLATIESVQENSKKNAQGTFFIFNF